MTKRQPCIYKITNLVDGKVYIGQTNVNFKTREYTHMYELSKGIHKNRHLQNAVKKYGIENFAIEKIQECETNELDDLEIAWINFFNSTNRDYGYNLEGGGNSNKIMHEETRTKLSEISKRNWKSPEYLKKMQEKIENFSGSNNPMAVKVICINDGKVFDTLIECANFYGLSNKSVCQVCRGERITTGGLQFSYYEENKSYELRDIPVYKGGEHHAARKVICINDNGIFDSVIEASEYYGISYQNLHQVILGKNKATQSKGGEWLQFAYYEEGETYKLQVIDESKIKTPKKVMCITTGQIFRSTREAAEKMGVQQSKISLVCNGKRNHTGGLTFKFIQ